MKFLANGFLVRVWLLSFIILVGGALGAQKAATEKKDPFTEAYKSADEAVQKNRVTNSFFAVGATLGNPAGLNANLSLYMWRLIFRGSGMFYGSNSFGAQADIGFSFLNANRTRHSFSLIGGYMSRKPLLALDPLLPNSKSGTVLSTPYFGVAYELFMDGVFVQVGGGWGTSSNYANPVLIFQAGYLFSFP